MATTTLLTFEEFLRLPEELEDEGKIELLDGEVVCVKTPKKHHKTANRLFRVLMPIVDSRGAAAGLGEMYLELEYKLGPRTLLRPDLSIEHASQSSGESEEGAPALAVEIISESNTAERMDWKVKAYMDHGAIETWLFYPKTRSVFVFRKDSIQEFRGVLRSDLISGLEIDLEAVFG